MHLVIWILLIIRTCRSKCHLRVNRSGPKSDSCGTPYAVYKKVKTERNRGNCSCQTHLFNNVGGVTKYSVRYFTYYIIHKFERNISNLHQHIQPIYLRVRNLNPGIRANKEPGPRAPRGPPPHLISAAEKDI